MKTKLKAFTLNTIAGANIATILVMLAVGYSDRLNPVSFPMLSNAGLAFPVFLIINFGFLVFWVLFKTRWVIIPFLGFLAGYAPIRTYCPVNIGHEPPADAIKVMSYNVWLFAGWADRPGEPNPILEYIRHQDADIVCLQESGISEINGKSVDAALNSIYQYHDTAMHHGGDCISIYSKYPIVKKEHIDYPSKGNISAAFTLRIKGRDVLVVNNHLETTSLSIHDKERFRTMIKGDMGADNARNTSKLLIDKLARATKIRAPQAEAVARYISHHSDMPIIVCGDFNDGPISYAHRTIARGLTDCYVETATGPGISYHHNGFFVRIDNIFCSSHFQPYKCYVDNKIKSSDHYPIICWLKMHPETTKKQ